MKRTDAGEGPLVEIAALLAQPKRSAYRLAKAVRQLQKDKASGLFDDLWRNGQIGRRRAFYLARIGEAFEGLPVPEYELERLGWTKLMVIAPGITADNAPSRLKLAATPRMTVKKLQGLLLKKPNGSPRRRLVISLSEGQHARAVATLKKFGAKNTDNGSLEGMAAALMALFDHLKKSAPVE